MIIIKKRLDLKSWRLLPRISVPCPAHKFTTDHFSSAHSSIRCYSAVHRSRLNNLSSVVKSLLMNNSLFANFKVS
jgi:hypothetical protein